MPVAVIHLLGERLGRLTAIGAPDVIVKNSHPGNPNTRLNLEQPWWASTEEMHQNFVPVPLIELHPEHIAQWAKMMMIPGFIYPYTVLLSSSPNATDQVAPQVIEEAPSAESRVARFRALVSPETFKLAVYLSVMPLSLPVIRLVQLAMLPHPHHWQLAELLVGGIIQRVSVSDDSALSNGFIYEFYDGVREVLQSFMPRAEHNRIIDYVSNLNELPRSKLRGIKPPLAYTRVPPVWRGDIRVACAP
jgi:hypothetical protein